MLVGRATEMVHLTHQLAQARQGRGNSTLLVGEPGIGKTALIDELCRRARGVRILKACGVESEMDLGFSALADLTKPLRDLFCELPGAQAAALQAALALTPATPGNPFAVFAGTLALLSAAATRSPLLVCVDDAQWIDVESARALGFCARRIYAEPIAIVVAVRSEEPRQLPRRTFQVLTLRGLDVTSSADLLTSASGANTTPEVAARLHTATGGNPLALLEVCAQLNRGQLEGRAEPTEPLPVGETIERMFAHRIAREPLAVRRALLVAATSRSGDLQEVCRALASAGRGTAELEHAEREGLITIAEGRVHFVHPLVRGVLLAAAEPPDRRAAHAALACAVSGPDAAIRRAWHRASATAGVDDRVALELEQAAAQMTARGGLVGAATALERAAALSEESEARARRLLGAGQAAHLAGMTDRARDRSREASEAARDPRLKADCERLRGIIELYSGDLRRASRLLVQAAEQVAPVDQAREALLLTDAALPLTAASDHRAAVELATRAVERAAGVGGEIEQIARKALGWSLILCGEARRGYPLMREGLEVETRQPASPEALLLLHFGANAAVWIEEYDDARRLTEALIVRFRSASALTPLPYALSVLAELEFRTGHWAAALAAATEAVGIATEIEQGGVAAYSLATLALIEAALGRDRATHDHADKALRIAGATGADSIRILVRAACGLLEMGRGRPEIAREQLAPLPALTRNRPRDPGVVWWQPDWVEACVRAGEMEEAERALVRLETEARMTGRQSALAAAARCRGMLASEETFKWHFADALARHEGTPTPFERARTQLCFGERLRRTGVRSRAREQLAEALDTFRTLGAEPWAVRAANELSATGRVRGGRTGDGTSRARLPQDVLTAQELQVAVAVANGATNKEAAVGLFLSPKTVEFHLSHIYGKLQVHSRTQLARVMLEPRP